jgi:glycosyltransferase involved in cell wall biosynthesis
VLKLALITEIIAPYRIPVFNAGAARPEIDLHVIFLSENDPSLRQWRVYKDEIKFHYSVLPSWRQRLGRYNLLVNRGAFSALNRFRPDAVLCGGYNYLASWEAALWAKAHGVPLLLWTESTALDQRAGHVPVEFMKARFLRMCQACVVSGKSSFRYLQELGIAREKIFTAPNAVDNDLFSKLAADTRRDESHVRARRSLPSRYFLYVGRLVKAKGVLELLDAYAQLDPEMRRQIGLVFVGDGAEFGKMREAAARIAPGTIQFSGFVHREELPEYYALADTLIFPTHSDPWGLVVNEALACSLPVIISEVAGCAEDLVQDGWNGFVLPPSDPAQLAMTMARLAGDSGLRLTMASNSKGKIAAYSPAAWAEGVVRAAQFVCANKKR